MDESTSVMTERCNDDCQLRETVVASFVWKKAMRMTTRRVPTAGERDVLGIVFHRSWSGVIVLLLLWFSSSGMTVTAAVMQDSGVSSLQEKASWEISDHSFTQAETTLRDVAFLNATHGWVAGQNETGLGGGIILNTTDGGDSWELQLYNRTQRFDAIEITESRTIWVTCKGGLVCSADNGQSWSSVSVIDGQAGLGGVWFFNRTHGWTSTTGDIYKTIDGGLTWQNVTSWQFDDVLRDMHFISLSHFWAIGSYGIYRTDDGGATWQAEYPRGGWAMSFVGDSEGWAVADDLLLHMTDGETWVEQAQPRESLDPRIDAPYYTDVLFKDQSHGWIVGLETPVAFTPNGGIDWYAQQVPEVVDRRMMAVAFANLTHGWAVGAGGYILRTVNGDGLGTLLALETGVPPLLILAGISVAAVICCCALFMVIRRRSRVSAVLAA